MKTSKNFWFFSEALPPQPLSSKEILSSLFNPPTGEKSPSYKWYNFAAV